MVETALTLVPLMSLLLGMVDVGMTVFLKSTFQNAVREGVRYAITYQTMPGMGHDASIKTVVQKYALGFVDPQQISVEYYDPNNPSTILTGVGSNGPNNIVEVSIRGYRWGWVVPFLFSNSSLEITASASDRMEGLPAGGSVPPR